LFAAELEQPTSEAHENFDSVSRHDSCTKKVYSTLMQQVSVTWTTCAVSYSYLAIQFHLHIASHLCSNDWNDDEVYKWSNMLL